MVIYLLQSVTGIFSLMSSYYCPISTFLSRDAMLAWYNAVILCLSECLSICLSQVGVIQRWLNLGSYKQSHSLVFYCQKSQRNSIAITPKQGRQIERLKSAIFEFLTIISLYLRNSAR